MRSVAGRSLWRRSPRGRADSDLAELFREVDGSMLAETTGVEMAGTTVRAHHCSLPGVRHWDILSIARGAS